MWRAHNMYMDLVGTYRQKECGLEFWDRNAYYLSQDAAKNRLPSQALWQR